MEYLIIVAVLVLVTGMSAVTLAQRKREPCTACRKGVLAIDRNFAHRCSTCGATFRMKHGKLERE